MRCTRASFKYFKKGRNLVNRDSIQASSELYEAVERTVNSHLKMIKMI